MSENANITTDLLTEARAQVAWRPFYQEQPPDHQEAMVIEQGRALAIYRAPIGQAALRVGAALDALIAEVNAFIEGWGHCGDAADAVRAALDAANLPQPSVSWATNFEADHFGPTIDELLTWAPVLHIMRERTEECEPLSTATGPAESEGRAAA